jgi:enterochelin esterase-like enzyme
MEFGGSRSAEFAEALARELVPRLVRDYRVDPSPANHIVMGGGSSGVTAALAAVSHPDALGGAALQSLDLHADAAEAVLEALSRRASRPGRFYVSWGRFDERDARGGGDRREDGRKLSAALTAAGHSVVGGETPDGAGWGAWRERNDRILGTFFAAGEQ